jgi:glycosyltransferase involved in cell wall biosynthesis
MTRIAFFAPYTEHVGTEGAMVRLADGLESRGYEVDLLRTYREWTDLDATPGRVVELDTRPTTVAVDRLPFPWKKLALAGTAVAGLVRYLRREEPAVLVAGLLTVPAIVARDVAGVGTKLVCSVQGLPRPDRSRLWLWPRLYRRAEAVVAPVQAVADRVVTYADLDPGRVRVVANPVVTEDLLARADKPPAHPWFAEADRIVVAVGRQTRQKDFTTLLRAFDRVADRTDEDVRLLVPGKEDEQTPALRRLVDQLAHGDAVDFPGFVDNPYAYMRAADVFVLSSRWEGPGHVLVEALAVGTPMVATDCPAGPRGILQDGEAGVLVPVGDDEAMAEGITSMLSDAEARERYAAAGREAAAPFRTGAAVEGYADLVADLLAPRGGDAT